jgi:hypothetical protein
MPRPKRELKTALEARAYVLRSLYDTLYNDISANGAAYLYENFHYPSDSDLAVAAAKSLLVDLEEMRQEALRGRRDARPNGSKRKPSRAT